MRHGSGLAPARRRMYSHGMLSSFDATAPKARRKRLARALAGQRALFAAGQTPPRNYKANTYPFRASSHFLYFVGLPLEGAVLLVDGEESTIYVEPKPDDDALWHGETPSHDELAARTGCVVRSIAELPDLSGVAAIAAVDETTRRMQREWLGRDVTKRRDVDLALEDAVITLRLVHDDAAQDGLRRAADATVQAHLAGRNATRIGALESEVQAAMESVFVARNMTTAYGSIVTVHGEVLHSHDHHGRLAEGDLLLADVGAETEDGWAGDVTRTWPVSGRFSTTQREMYEVVLRAQLDAIAKVAPGVRYRDVHLAACHTLARGLVELGVLKGDPQELVADGVHALLFPHGIGHLLGLDVHDMEDLGDRAGYAKGRERASQFGLAYLRLDRDLEVGMAVTIEPGLYRVPAILGRADLRATAKGRLDWTRLAAFSDVRGIRIEDDVLVTESGRDVLTKGAPKHVPEIER